MTLAHLPHRLNCKTPMQPSSGMSELADDARHYLELFEALQHEPADSDERPGLEAEAEVQVIVLKTHASHLSELIDLLDDEP
jgi:hypothetical protein